MTDANRELIHKYLPSLTELQFEQLSKAILTWQEWNQKVNVISRKDMDALVERHILHSIAIEKVLSFPAGSRIIDVGSGGGFPGIPLAILRPDCHFTLLDSVSKKMFVAQEVVLAASLQNVKIMVGRSEACTLTFDYVVSRAVTKMVDFIPMVRHLIATHPKKTPANGILYLKGGEPDGDLGMELRESLHPYQLYSLKEVIDLPFFETKYLVHIPFVR
jgi:16S rRNA (guanine527-N7)-methyltransferase